LISFFLGALPQQLITTLLERFTKRKADNPDLAS